MLTFYLQTNTYIVHFLVYSHIFFLLLLKICAGNFVVWFDSLVPDGAKRHLF